MCNLQEKSGFLNMLAYISSLSVHISHLQNTSSKTFLFSLQVTETPETRQEIVIMGTYRRVSSANGRQKNRKIGI